MESLPPFKKEKMDTPRTPFFAYDLSKISKKIGYLKKLQEKVPFKILYSEKACGEYRILTLMKDHIDGFSVSSLKEAKVERRDDQYLQFVTPGIFPHQWEYIHDFATHVTFNSVEQLCQFGGKLKDDVKYGLRVDPEISFINDPRYDPCRKFSKLGSTVERISNFLTDPSWDHKITGLHFHTNCESKDLSHLNEVIFEKIDDLICSFDISWLNLGGGYVFDQINANISLPVIIRRLMREHPHLEILIEPGSYFVKEAGSLVASVIDIMEKNGRQIAVLDTTVNHLPEVLEFGEEPNVQGNNLFNQHDYILAGCTCLAGDVFGEYSFDKKLKVGSQIVFENVGAYTLSKANTFNGIPIPKVVYTDAYNS